MKTEKGKPSPQDLDLRVRARHLASGMLEQKVVDKHLADLVDVESNCETVLFDQPALGGRDQGGA
jgi:hypothetical protein